MYGRHALVLAHNSGLQLYTTFDDGVRLDWERREPLDKIKLIDAYAVISNSKLILCYCRNRHVYILTDLTKLNCRQSYGYEQPLAFLPMGKAVFKVMTQNKWCVYIDVNYQSFPMAMSAGNISVCGCGGVNIAIVDADTQKLHIFSDNRELCRHQKQN